MSKGRSALASALRPFVLLLGLKLRTCMFTLANGLRSGTNVYKGGEIFAGSETDVNTTGIEEVREGHTLRMDLELA